MHEALRKISGAAWLSNRNDEPPAPPTPPTPLEHAEGLVLLAKVQGQIDRASSTWNAVARWAASELIVVQMALETAEGDRAAMLRSRAKTLRDVLAIDERGESRTQIVDSGPDIIP